MICIAAAVLQNTANTVLRRTKTILVKCFPDHHFNLRLGAQRIIEMSSFSLYFLSSQDNGHQAPASAFHCIISSKESPKKKKQGMREKGKNMALGKKRKRRKRKERIERI